MNQAKYLQFFLCSFFVHKQQQKNFDIQDENLFGLALGTRHPNIFQIIIASVVKIVFTKKNL